MAMSKKYGCLQVSVEDFYKFIGTIVCYSNKITISTSNVFDVEIKSINYMDKLYGNKKISMQPIIDRSLISTHFDEFIITRCFEYFILYFESEETALYFSLKYCS